MVPNLGFEANRRDFGLFTNEQRRVNIGQEEETNNSINNL